MPRSIFYSKAAAFTYACSWLLYIKDAFLCLGISDVSMSKSRVYNNKISAIWGPVATTLAISMYIVEIFGREILTIYKKFVNFVNIFLRQKFAPYVCNSFITINNTYVVAQVHITSLLLTTIHCNCTWLWQLPINLSLKLHYPSTHLINDINICS